MLLPSPLASACLASDSIKPGAPSAPRAATDQRPSGTLGSRHLQEPGAFCERGGCVRAGGTGGGGRGGRGRAPLGGRSPSAIPDARGGVGLLSGSLVRTP